MSKCSPGRWRAAASDRAPPHPSLVAQTLEEARALLASVDPPETDHA